MAHRDFNFEKSAAAIVVANSLITFSSQKKMKVTRYNNLQNSFIPIVKQLTPLRTRKRLSRIAVASYRDRFVILTGGYDLESKSTRGETLMFDVETDLWLSQPGLPDLGEPRHSHSSCATG